MKKCYVIMGSTGAYSDLQEWIAKVFIFKKKAIKEVDELNDILIKLKLDPKNKKYLSFKEPYPKEIIDKDINFCYDSFTGSEYRLEESFISDWEKK